MTVTQLRLPSPRAGDSCRAEGLARAAAPPRRRRVAVVARHALEAEALGRALPLTVQPVAVPIDAYTTTADATAAVLRARADVVVVLDPRGLTVDPVALIAGLDLQHVVVAGDLSRDLPAQDYLAAGAEVVIDRPHVADVVTAVEAVLWLPPLRSPRTCPPARHGAPYRRPGPDQVARHLLGRLSATEAQVLRALMDGRTAEDIARDKVLSVSTVRTQIRDVLRKLEVSSQLTAVAVAWRGGWTPEPTTTD